jgi:hypothetical protein
MLNSNYEQMDIIRTELLWTNKHQTTSNDVNFDMFNIFELLLQHVLIDDDDDVIRDDSHLPILFILNSTHTHTDRK